MAVAAAVAIAGTLLSAYSTYKAGQASKEASLKQQSLLNRQGEEVMARAQINDELLQKQGRQLVGAQRVAIAGSGIDIGAGSSLDIIEDTIIEINDERLRLMRDSVFEANMIAEGAKLEGDYARDAATAGMIGGAGTLLTSGYNIWKNRPTPQAIEPPSSTIGYGVTQTGSSINTIARPMQSIEMR